MTENAWTQLVHAMHLWHGVIKQVLWLFTLNAVAWAHNKFKSDPNLIYPEEKFIRFKLI